MGIKNLFEKAKPYVLVGGLSLVTLVGCSDNKLSKYNISNLDLDSAKISFESDWALFRDSPKNISVIVEENDSLKYVYTASSSLTEDSALSFVTHIAIYDKKDNLLDEYSFFDEEPFQIKAIEKGEERFNAYLKIIIYHRDKNEMNKVNNYFK